MESGDGCRHGGRRWLGASGTQVGGWRHVALVDDWGGERRRRWGGDNFSAIRAGVHANVGHFGEVFLLAEEEGQRGISESLVRCFVSALFRWCNLER